MITTASAKLIDPVLQVARHVRQDPNTLLSHIGLPPEAINNAGARIPAALFSSLLRELAQRCGNPRIALRTGEATQPRMLGSVGFLISTAPTLGVALRLLNDYLPLLIEGVHLSLEQQQDDAELVLDLQQDDDRPLVEWLLACLHSWPRWLIGQQMPLRQVEMAFAPPPAPMLYEQFFAAEVQFNAPRNRLRFPAQLLQQPCLEANEELHRHHRQFADQLLSSAGRDGALVAQVKSLIRNQIAAGDAAIGREQVAEALHLSLRTLQRKLDQQGTHFQALYDQTRQDMALQLIQRGDKSFGEIAYQLGFSGLSAFQKAFKRWTGLPPGLYRTEQRPRTLVPEQELPRTLADRIAQGGIHEAELYPLALLLLELVQQRPRNAPPPLLHPALIHLDADRRGGQHLRLSEAPPSNTLSLSEELAFSAPEANGLLPERLRPATQLYEVGVLLYALLHGQPPLHNLDATSLLRGQLEHSPSFDPQLSPPLRALLHKLLTLEMEQRYQTFDGLAQDLRHLQLLHPDERAIWYAFEPGLHDQPDPLAHPDPLPARAAEQQHLEYLLQRCRHNDGRLLLLEGEPGSGKSALIDSLRRSVYRSQGMLLRIPLRPGDSARQLEPLQFALRRLLRQKLSAPPARRELWSQQLRRELGTQFPLTAAWLPELKQLSAAAQPVEGLPGDGLANAEQPSDDTHAGNVLGLSRLTRGHYRQQRLEAVTTLLSLQRDPLVLFFDDLEHAGDDILQLLQNLQSRLGSQPLLLIASYSNARLSADSACHRLLPLLSSHRQSTLLTLPPLNRAEVHQLLQQLLGGMSSESHRLADWLYQQSHGNPAALQAQLRQLRQQDKLHYSAEARCWQWQQGPLPGLASSALQARLRQLVEELPPVTREHLQWAAALGDPFDLNLLATARQDPLPRIAIHLWPAEQNGILRPGVESTGQGQFSHPELPELLLQPLSAADAAPIHLRIARALQNQTLDESSARDLSTIATHLTHAYTPSRRDSLRRELLQLHRDAARQQQAHAAHETALTHYHAGLALLQPHDDVSLAPLCHDLLAEGISLLLQGVRPSYASGPTTLASSPAATIIARVEAWLARLEQLPQLASTPQLTGLNALTRARLQRIAGQPQAAWQLLLQALDQQGLRLCDETQQLSTLEEQLATLSTANALSLSAPHNWPLLDELLWLAEQQLQPRRLAAALLARTQLDPPCALSAQLLQQQVLGQFTPSATPAPSTPCASWLVGARLLPWCAPLHDVLAQLQHSLELAQQQNLELPLPTQLLSLFHSHWLGTQPLPELIEALELELARLPALLGTATTQPLQALLQLWRYLCGAPTTAGTAPDTPKADPTDTADAAPWLLLSRALEAYLLQQRQDWPALLRGLETAASRLGGLLAEAQLLLLGGLMAAQLAASASHSERPYWLRLLQRQCARFEVWAAHNPALFNAPAALLAAEWQTLVPPDNGRAGPAFEQALLLADACGSPLLAALSRERYAAHWQHQQHPHLALLLQRDAAHYWRQWGAQRLCD